MRKPTEKMLNFATKIFETLDFSEDDEPDWDSFDDVSEFIDEYKVAYFDRLNRRF